MKPDRRMNLFRVLITQSAEAFKMPKIQLGLQGWACVVVVVFFGYLTFSKLQKFKVDFEATQKRQLEIDEQVNKLVAEATVVAEEEARLKIAAAKAKKEEKAQETVREISQVTSQIDGSWASVLWKLTTHASDILMSRVELGGKDKKAGTAGGESKFVSIDGQASSLIALARWVEYLNVHLPTGAVVVEKHSRTGDKNFPVVFRVTARVGL